MDSTPARLSTLVGVGGSLLFHAAVGTWLALAPAPTFHVDRPGGENGFDLSLVPPRTDLPTPTAPEAAKPAPTPEEAKPSTPPEPQDTSKAPPPPPPPPPPTELDGDKIKMGIDESAAPPETKTFLGEATPTENLAPTSTVEQPALNPAPGKSGTSGLQKTPSDEPPSPMPPEAPAPTPSEETRPIPSPEASLPTPAAPAPGPSGETAPSEAAPAEANVPATDAAPGEATPPMPEGPPVPPTPGPSEVSDEKPTPDAAPTDSKTGDNRAVATALLQELFGQLPIAIPGRGFVYIAPPPGSLPRTAPAATKPPGGGSPASAVAAAAPAPTGSPGADKARAGEKSVKESSAFTLKKTLEYKPGKPLAAEGIEVTTVDPEIPILSSMTGVVRNPVILLHFGPDGKVKLAEFKDGLDAGRDDWNDPIMHAMHRWTLGGKKFQQLIAESPGREIVMSVRLLLR